MIKDRTVETLELRRQELEDERSTWEAGWRSIQEHILPRRGRFLEERAAEDANRGDVASPFRGGPEIHIRRTSPFS